MSHAQQMPAQMAGSPVEALARRHGELRPAFGDPHPYYRQLRAQGLHVGDMGVWIAARHADVQAAFRHPGIANQPHPAGVQARILSRRVIAEAPFELLVRRLFDLGGIRHGETRRILESQVRGPRLRDHLIDLHEFAATVLSHVASAQPVDLIENVAFPIAARLVLRLLGIADDLHGEYLAVLRRLAESLGPNQDPDRMIAADLCVTDGLRILGHSQPSSLTPDPLDALAVGVLVYMAALEPGAYLIGNAVLAMLETPVLREELRGGTVLAAMVEEVLRYCAPLQMVGKTVLRDVRINGVDIPGPSQLALVIGAANRDPEVFEDPDRFDSTRSPNPHLTLANGHRACVGGPLVRGMLKTLLPMLSAALTETPASTERSWRQSYQLRGLQHLQVMVGQVAS